MRNTIICSKIAVVSLIILLTFFPEKVLCFDGGKDNTSNHNQFAFDLLKKAPSQKNVFFSPYSISMALNILYEGTEGETAKEIERVLHRDLSKKSISLISSEDKPYDLFVANALWKRNEGKIIKSYVELITNRFGSHLEELNFCSNPEKSRKIINSWVSIITKNNINHLLPPGSIDCKTPLIITNAIYFKSDWKYKFLESETRQEIFSLSNGKSIKTDFMQLKGRFHYHHDREFNNDIIEIPYKGDDLSMYVVLPAKDADIDGTIHNISSQYFAELKNKLRRRNVIIRFPKFKYALYYNDLTSVIANLGMKTIFTNNADFSKMKEGPGNTYLSEIIHKALIEVNEEGTTAAAAIAIKVTESDDIHRTPRIFKFFADHPFVFVIYHKPSGNILFVGKVENPSES